MGFLVITCIGPVSKFLGCIPLGISMIIMTAIVLAIAGYTYGESTIYFKNEKVFGFLSKEIYLAIELAVAVMVFIVFLVQKRSYSRIVYLVTLALAGFGLAINIYKLSVFKVEESISVEKERNFIKWLYFIRIGMEFLTEMMVCYMVYSMKKKE